MKHIIGPLERYGPRSLQKLRNATWHKNGSPGTFELTDFALNGFPLLRIRGRTPAKNLVRCRIKISRTRHPDMLGRVVPSLSKKPLIVSCLVDRRAVRGTSSFLFGISKPYRYLTTSFDLRHPSAYEIWVSTC